MAVFLVVTPGRDVPESDGPWREQRRLQDGVLLVDSEQSRSRVYHAVKDLLPEGAALLVSELDRVPKFRGMAPGTLRWSRERMRR